jgi:hypothetical protein
MECSPFNLAVLHPEVQFLANARSFFDAGVAELVAQFVDDLAAVGAGCGRDHRKTPTVCSNNYIFADLRPEL